ncbi:ribonuclease J [Candidatus Uhrbacteria bacterium CG_4_9_14_3_um_filter_36_7]|uniref:Ribonuclease J n=1 Tax=Candidatus Uhrbacteria bacterium CG_4_9_14_3_um_filter_36_7 TaxID=1975033 RepID=A0A2M7XFY0_9BACT|nr:MAG: ribonuclease J [Candidatus Uhrbacteria bacterium CG_4_9_14_3_um_filter_36_7]
MVQRIYRPRQHARTAVPSSPSVPKIEMKLSSLPTTSRTSHTNRERPFRGRVFRRSEKISSKKQGSLRIAVLGGCEEVGRNCTLLEYDDDIIIIDMGLEFPGEEMPGIDYIIPNMSYLKGKEKNIRGVIITHAHYDHIGGIPHTIPQIGNPPLFGLPLTAAIIKKRQTDFETKPINMNVVKLNETLQLGKFRILFFHINHNIPDSVGVVIETPIGTICHTGDWKFDFHPVGTERADFQRIAEIGRKGVLVLLGDSTNASKPGHTPSEDDIGKNLEQIIKQAPGRIIVGTFASLLSRVKQVIEISESLGKKIAMDGYSMKTNVEIAKALGYIKAKSNAFILPEHIHQYPDNKVVFLCTGAQGERNAALHRIATNEHRFVRVQKGDTVIFSSSIVPGNEASVQKLKDTLYRKGAKVIHYQMMDVHASGHAYKEDIKLLLALIQPKYYIPIEGNHFLLRENAEIAYSMGWKEDQVLILDNGQVVECQNDKITATKEKLPTDYVFVDGLGVGDVSQVVLRDRKVLAEDGMVVIIVQIDRKTGALVASPDIISRGFIFMKENRELIEATRKHIKALIANKDSKSEADTDYIKNTIRNEMGAFLFKKTERRPMILPVILEV